MEGVAVREDITDSGDDERARARRVRVRAGSSRRRGTMSAMSSGSRGRRVKPDKWCATNVLPIAVMSLRFRARVDVRSRDLCHTHAARGESVVVPSRRYFAVHNSENPKPNIATPAPRSTQRVHPSRSNRFVRPPAAVPMIRSGRPFPRP